MLLAMILLAMMLSYGSETAAIETAAYKSVACDFFGPDNAAKLLGAKFRGEDGGMSDDAEGRKWRCTFMQTVDANEKGPKIHFMLIKSPTSEAAARAFDDVRTSGTRTSLFATEITQADKDVRVPSRWQEWTGVGDEAAVHSDLPNFHMIMVRNGAKTIRIKVNPANGVSVEDSKSIAMSLAAKLAKQ